MAAVCEADLLLLSVTVIVTDPAPAVLSAVKVTTTLPVLVPAAGSDFLAADPPVAVVVTDLYPPGTFTAKVTSTSFDICTSDAAGGVKEGASGEASSSSSHATNAIANADMASMDTNFLMSWIFSFLLRFNSSKVGAYC
jgi:hypothetical protein